MCLPYSFTPAFLAARNILDQGLIGTVTMARSRVAHGGPGPLRRQHFPGEEEEPNWFYVREIARGGCLFDMGVYAISQITGLLGPVERVTGLASTPVRPVDVETNVILALEFASGAIGSIETSWCQAASQEGMTLHGIEGTLTFGPNLGEGGEMDVYLQPRSIVGRQGWTRPELERTPCYLSRAHRCWVDCILHGGKPLATPQQGRHVVEIMTAG